MNTSVKPLPTLVSDETADLSDYDLSGLKPVQFEIVEKESALNIPAPAVLRNAGKC